MKLINIKRCSFNFGFYRSLFDPVNLRVVINHLGVLGFKIY